MASTSTATTCSSTNHHHHPTTTTMTMKDMIEQMICMNNHAVSLLERGMYETSLKILETSIRTFKREFQARSSTPIAASCPGGGTGPPPPQQNDNSLRHLRVVVAASHTRLSEQRHVPAHPTPVDDDENSPAYRLGCIFDRGLRLSTGTSTNTTAAANTTPPPTAPVPAVFENHQEQEEEETTAVSERIFSCLLYNLGLVYQTMGILLETASLSPPITTTSLVFSKDHCYKNAMRLYRLVDGLLASSQQQLPSSSSTSPPSPTTTTNVDNANAAAAASATVAAASHPNEEQQQAQQPNATTTTTSSNSNSNNNNESSLSSILLLRLASIHNQGHACYSCFHDPHMSYRSGHTIVSILQSYAAATAAAAAAAAAARPSSSSPPVVCASSPPQPQPPSSRGPSAMPVEEAEEVQQQQDYDYTNGSTSSRAHPQEEDEDENRHDHDSMIKVYISYFYISAMWFYGQSVEPAPAA